MSKDRRPKGRGHQKDPAPSAPPASFEEDPPSCVPSAPPPPSSVPQQVYIEEKVQPGRECPICLDPLQRYSDHCCTQRISGRSRPESKVPPPIEAKSEQPEEEEFDDCPICLEPISATSAVMRCRTRPRPHYFHAHCLQAWAKAAQANCPMCRGEVEFNVQNLGRFIQGSREENILTEGELGFLESIYKSVEDKAHEGWAKCTWENVQYAGGLLAYFSMGFYAGYSDRIPGLSYQMVDIIPTSTHNRVAQGVGWFTGFFAKEVWKRTKDDEERRRRR